jgi:ribosomal protein L37AE/L43A
VKETKRARKKRIFGGMKLADLCLFKEHHRLTEKLPRGMKIEELVAEIERREVIAKRTKGQFRAGGRFATPTLHPLEERLRQATREDVGIFAKLKEERLHTFTCTCGRKIVIPPRAPEILTCPKCGAIYAKGYGIPEPLEDMLRRVIRRELEIRDEKLDRALLDAIENRGPEKRPSLLRRLKRWLI